MTAPRFLVDENLSVKLPEAAHQRGFEATHVVHLGLTSGQDWDILDVIDKHEWILVPTMLSSFVQGTAQSRFILVLFSCCHRRGENSS